MNGPNASDASEGAVSEAHDALAIEQAENIAIPTREELHALRCSVGLSRPELSELAGVSTTAIAGLERARTDPRMSTVVQIVAVLQQLNAQTND